MARVKREVKPGRRVASFVRNERPPAPARGPVYRALAGFTRRLKSHPASQLLAIAAAVVAFAATTAAAVGVMFELQELEADRIARQEERHQRQRTELYRPAPGENGKGSILTQLIADNAIESYIDLSCRRIGIWESDRCTERPVLSELSINPSGGWLKRSTGGELDFSQTTLLDFVFEQTEPGEPVRLALRANLDRTRFLGGRVRGTAMTGSFEGARFDGVDLGLASFFGSGNEQTRIDGNLSGFYLELFPAAYEDGWPEPGAGGWWFIDPAVPFCDKGAFVRFQPEFGMSEYTICLEADRQPQLEGWFWADRPPRAHPDWLNLRKMEDGRPVACDPRRLDTVGKAPWTDQTAPLDDWDVRNTCVSMSWKEARETFPDRWDPEIGPYCEDHRDLAFVARHRTVAPQPCRIVER